MKIPTLFCNAHFANGLSKQQIPFEMYLYPSRQEWERLVNGQIADTLTYDIEFPDDHFVYTIRTTSK